MDIVKEAERYLEHYCKRTNMVVSAQAEKHIKALLNKIEQLTIVASGHKELSELMEKRWHEVSAESMERGDLIRQLRKKTS